MSNEKDPIIPEVQDRELVTVGVGELATNHEGAIEPVKIGIEGQSILSEMKVNFISGYRDGFHGWRRSLRERISR